MAQRLEVAPLLARARERLAGRGLGAVLLRGAGGAAGVQVLGALLALLAQLVLARLLGLSQYGYYVYAFTWVVILAQLCRLGFHNSLIRFTASYRANGDWSGLRGLVARSSQLVLLTSLGVGALFAAAALSLRDGMPPGQLATFLAAAVLLVPLALLGVTQGVLQGCRRPALALLPIRALVHGGTLALVLAAAAVTGLTTGAAAMWLTVVATALTLALAMHWTRLTIPAEVDRADPEYRTRLWLAVSLPMLFMAGMQLLMKRIDTIMLGALAGAEAAGLYFPVARISELAALGLMSVAAIVAPMISELHSQGHRARLQRLLALAAIGTSAVTLVAAGALAVAGEWILGLFGEAFPAVYPALVVLLAGQVAGAFCGPAHFVLTMTGHQNRAALVHTGAAGLNIGLNAILIPSHGVMGAAIATAASTFAWNLWMLGETLVRLRLDPSVVSPWSRRWLKTP